MSGDELEHVAFHHADFCFEAHRQAVEASRCAGAGIAAAPLAEHEASASWDAFHRQHAGAAFFKARRYLLAEFPQLRKRGQELTVLELGCGNGSSCLPLLLANPDVRVVACDFATAAVAATRQAVTHAGVSVDRFVAFQADPGAVSADEFAAALAAAVSLAGWPPLARFDAVLAVFVLSAVPPARTASFLASACSLLRPGGCLLVRDYGIFDQAHLRFSPEAACDDSGCLFLRQDGTLARFFDRDELVDLVCSGAANAGVHLAGEADWHTVAVRNRAKDITMRRVFVHAVFTRALDNA